MHYEDSWCSEVTRWLKISWKVMNSHENLKILVFQGIQLCCNARVITLQCHSTEIQLFTHALWGFLLFWDDSMTQNIMKSHENLKILVFQGIQPCCNTSVITLQCNLTEIQSFTHALWGFLMFWGVWVLRSCLSFMKIMKIWKFMKILKTCWTHQTNHLHSAQV